jgi:hypothetical protein
VSIPIAHFDMVPLAQRIESDLFVALEHLRAAVEVGNVRDPATSIRVYESEASLARAKSALLDLLQELRSERAIERVRAKDAAAYKRKTGRGPGARQRIHGPDGRISWRDRTMSSDEPGAKIDDAVVENEEKQCHG